MEWYEWILLPLVGAAGGFLAGLLGVGGGLIFIPLLTMLFERLGLPGAEVVKFTLANSIFLVVCSGLAGIYRLRKTGDWDWRRSLSTGIPGAASSVFFTWLIQQGDWYNKERFQIVFLGFLLISVGNMLFGKQIKDAGIEEKRGSVKESLVGLLAGMVVAFSGLGGGVVMVPLFRMFLHMPMQRATALSLSIIPMLGLPSVAKYILGSGIPSLPVAHSGYFVWPYAIPMAAGVLIFASVGMKTARKLPETTVRIIFASLSGIFILKIIYDIVQKTL
jgi:uncharacterized membrane protein YfcA